MTLDELVTAARAEVPDCSVVRIWGGNVFRPGDVVYAVKSVSAKDGALRVELFLALDNTTAIVEVLGADGLKVKKGSLKIQSASEVRWDGAARPKPAGTTEPALHLGH
ncbi:MAG: hypothetical protein JST92_13275 [Deltaproteobacteria bacterium]|nr:hypothetical protein [Deltaproteobacteria bacterium]